MRNAKTEFLDLVEGTKASLLCATLSLYDIKHNLKLGYSEEEYQSFLNSIDKEYDGGFGTQELDGVVWFSTVWADRGEYDGSEWWDLHVKPEIPEELK